MTARASVVLCIAAALLIDLICDRANYVVNTITARLVDEPELPWVGGNG